MSNIKNKSQENIGIQKLEGELDEVEIRRSALRKEFFLPEIKKNALTVLQQKRISLLAQGMASGDVVDTSEVDAEIVAATKDEKDAIEQAEAARAAIALLDKREEEIQERIGGLERRLRIAGLAHYETNLADSRQSLNKARHDLAEAQRREAMLLNEVKQLIQNNLMGRVEKAFEACDEVMPLLQSRLSAMPPFPYLREEGTTFFVNEKAGRVVVIGEEENKAVLKQAVDENANLSDVLRRMELQLAAAAPYAEMLEVVWDEGATKRTLIKYLGNISRGVRAAAIAAKITVPEWAFLGENFYAKWVTTEKLEPVKQFLNDSGLTW